MDTIGPPCQKNMPFGPYLESLGYDLGSGASVRVDAGIMVRPCQRPLPTLLLIKTMGLLMCVYLMVARLWGCQRLKGDSCPWAYENRSRLQVTSLEVGSSCSSQRRLL